MSDFRLVIRGYYHLEFIIVIKKIVIPRKVFKWEEIGWGEPISFLLFLGVVEGLRRQEAFHVQVLSTGNAKGFIFY